MSAAPMSDVLSIFLQDSQTRIDRAIDSILAQVAHSETTLIEAMRYSLLNGGKRIRPVLVYASALAVGGVLNPVTDKVAAALEFIHAYSLIHDDLPAMDDDDLRRGKPTCHIAFNEATAILAGDGLQALAFEVLAGAAELASDIRLQLVQQLAFAAGAQGMVGGQAIDLASVNTALDLQQLQHMHNLKTGALISASVLMGATATAQATAAQLAALKTYADAIGLAFQVQDDILDVTADVAVLGKQTGADSALNKPTYVALLGLEGARQKARELQQQALAALEIFGDEAEILRLLAAYIVERNK